MPLTRIALFAGASVKQKKSQAKFTECARDCRRDAPQKGKFGPCLSVCMKPVGGSKKRRQRRRRK